MILKFWKNAATAIERELTQGTVVVIKHGMVKSYTHNQYTETSVNVNSDTTYWPDPEIEEAENLKTWMEAKLNE